MTTKHTHAVTTPHQARSPLRARWHLIWELTKSEILDRYRGHLIGPLWAVGHPILLMGTYVFLFTFVFPMRLPLDEGMPRSVPVYILAGLVPWLSFSELMGRATVLITANASMVKQVVFPLEALPIKSSLASFFNQLVATLVLVILLITEKNQPPVTLVLVPLLFMFQLLAMLGVAYFLAAIGPFFRDIKDLVQAFLPLGLFLAPILYLPTMLTSVWSPLGVVLNVNPFSHMVWCYQDAYFFGEIRHPVSWLVFSIGSVVTWYVGQRFFARVRHFFADVL